MSGNEPLSPMSAGPYLKTELRSTSINLLAAVNKVAALTKKSPRSVAFALFRGAVGKQRYLPEEYFGLGLWRTTLTPDQRAAFTTNRTMAKFNRSMIGHSHFDASAMMRDKYFTGLVLTANGFDNPQPFAAFSPDRSFGNLCTFTTVEELAAYFADPTRPALFGKPVNGSRAMGVCPVMTVLPGATTVGVGQGREAGFVDLAREVAQNYPRGWLMQELIEQPADVIDLAGVGVSSVRVVTVWETDGPTILYAAWKLVAKGATSDAIVAGPRVLAKVDPTTGEVLHAQVGDFLYGKSVLHSPSNPDRPLIGYQIPDWPKILQICNDGHRMYPGHAIVGWDIALSNRGPLVQEVNGTPMQDIYQKSHDRGFFSADFLARFAEARALLDARQIRYGSVVRVPKANKSQIR